MAFQTYIKFDGIESPQRDGIEVLSFSWGAQEQVARGSGAATGKVVLNDLQITKHVDSTSPKLMEACVTGQHFQKADLTALAGNFEGKFHTILKLSLSDIFVTSVQMSGNEAGEDRPTEQVSLAYKKFELSVTD